VAHLAFEKVNYDDLVHFIKEEKLDKECDLVLLRAVDACMNEKALEKFKSAWKAMCAARGNMLDMECHGATSTAKVRKITPCIMPGVDMMQEFRMPAAHGSVSYLAATLWPYKLTISLLKVAINRDVQLCTESPVHSIERNDALSPWTPRTPQGILVAKNIVHATNGYASYLLPEFTDKLIPCKGYAAAAEPLENFFSSPLQTSFSF
jgi:glycine/D-amino acid oxidase-like deaminating enzyme